MPAKKDAAADKAVTDQAPEAVEELSTATASKAKAGVNGKGMTLDQQQVYAALHAGE